jgi:hypothetical protein
MTLRCVLALVGALWVAMALGCGAAEMAPPSAAAPRGAFGGEAAPAASPPPEAPGGFAGLEEAFKGSDRGGAADSGAAAPAASAAPAAPTENPAPTSTSQAPAFRGPMLVYTAMLRLAVIQVAEASKEIERMARESGGWLSRRDDTEIVIRVPVARFEDTMKRLEKLGDVVHRNVTAEDVTEQFMDAEVRLKSARAVRDRLKALLEKATKVEDSLAIEKELSRIDTEIEQLEARLKYLREQAQFSTITVQLQAKQQDDVGKKPVRIPVDWLDQLGLGRLLSL